MKKSYYLFNPGRLSRKDNTLKFVPIDEEGKEGQARYLPVEGIKELYVFGSLDANSALYNFLGQQGIVVHFFNYYEYYTGSFMPRDYLLAGKVQIAQTKTYLNANKRLALARRLIEGATHNMLKNLRYYVGRGAPLQTPITQIEALWQSTATAPDIETLMGIEGNIRQTYYECFEHIVSDFAFEKRSKRPPENELNTLISFGNMLCYTLCLRQIFHTQLNPTISFLHEPGTRRYSLALDLAEVFKPLLVDRTIFSILNKKILQASDFRTEVGGCTLRPAAAKKFVTHWEERLQTTIQHRTLKRKVSYEHLVRLECYKLIKHVLEIQDYKPFKAWW
jgi:CRISPR-associated protein Cas1